MPQFPRNTSTLILGTTSRLKMNGSNSGLKNAAALAAPANHVQWHYPVETPAPPFHHHHAGLVYGWWCIGDQVVKATVCLDKGFNSITIIMELRNHHDQGEINADLHVGKGMQQGSDSNDIVFPR